MGSCIDKVTVSQYVCHCTLDSSTFAFFSSGFGAAFFSSTGFLGSSFGFSGSFGFLGSSFGFSGSFSFAGSAFFSGSLGFSASGFFSGSLGFAGSGFFSGSLGFSGSGFFSGSAFFSASLGLASGFFSGSFGFSGSFSFGFSCSAFFYRTISVWMNKYHSNTLFSDYSDWTFFLTDLDSHFCYCLYNTYFLFNNVIQYLWSKIILDCAYLILLRYFAKKNCTKTLVCWTRFPLTWPKKIKSLQKHNTHYFSRVIK